MNKIQLPTNNKTNTTNATTLKNAINKLSDYYMIDSPYMENDDKIKLLETIVDLTNLYINYTKGDQTNCF